MDVKQGIHQALCWPHLLRTVHPTCPESSTAEHTPRPSRQDAALPESRPVLKCSHTGPVPPRLPKRSSGPCGSTSSRALPGPPARSFRSLADAQTELRQLAAGNSLAKGERVGRRPARAVACAWVLLASSHQTGWRAGEGARWWLHKWAQRRMPPTPASPALKPASRKRASPSPQGDHSWFTQRSRCCYHRWGLGGEGSRLNGARRL